MIKRKGQTSTTSKSQPDLLSRELRSIRADRVRRFSFNHDNSINLSLFKNSKPCPICGTILDEILNTSIHVHFENRKSKGEEAPWVCSYCAQRMIDPPVIKTAKVASIHPRGWKFMTVYVDINSNVFFKGIEQPELKGTLPISIIDKTIPEKKVSKVKKAELKHAALLKLQNAKLELKRGVDSNGKPYKKSHIAALESTIKKQEKIIHKL